MQFLGLAAVVGIVGVAGVGAASTLRNSNPPAVTTSEGGVSVPERATAKTTTATKPTTVVQQSAPAEAPASPPPVAPPVRPASRGGFVLVEGRTKLIDSVHATRTADSVVVNFDAYGFRTRRASKIEQSLRLTLPLVFGRTATASLDTVPAGQLVTTRDVVGALATEGMRLTLDNGVAVHIRVLTRVVSDGPIAIGYLATIGR